MKLILALAAAVSLASCATRDVSTGGGMTLECRGADYCPPSRAHSSKTEVSIFTRNFTFPWAAKPAPRTEFRANIAGGRLHFAFDCDDRDLVIAREWRGESTLDGEDRVEIFFARDATLSRYFCIEIDALGRVHDYAASHYRKFDSAWDCPGLRTAARRTKSGYRVDASLPLSALSTMMSRPVRSSDTVLAGLFRAEFYGSEPRTHGDADDNWLSWVRPTTKTPDFHVPSAFTHFTLP